MSTKSFIHFLLFYILATLHSPASQGSSAEFRLLIEDWNGYLESNPRVIQTGNIPEDILEIIGEGHVIISSIFNNTKKDNTYYLNRLNHLKSFIPTTISRSGESQVRDKILDRSATYSLSGNLNGYVSNYAVNTNFNAQGNYQEYQHYYRSVTKSSDESLHRVVENITSNISIERLAQYIDALRSHWKKWTNITENISNAVGSAGVLKEANVAYLELLDTHIKNFEMLSDEINEKDTKHQLMLRKWKSYKTNKLVLLRDYFNKKGNYIEVGDRGDFIVPDYSTSTNLVLEFPTSELVYFNLNTLDSGDLPFKLIQF